MVPQKSICIIYNEFPLQPNVNLYSMHMQAEQQWLLMHNTNALTSKARWPYMYVSVCVWSKKCISSFRYCFFFLFERSCLRIAVQQKQHLHLAMLLVWLVVRPLLRKMLAYVGFVLQPRFKSLYHPLCVQIKMDWLI